MCRTSPPAPPPDSTPDARLLEEAIEGLARALRAVSSVGGPTELADVGIAYSTGTTGLPLSSV